MEGQIIGQHLIPHVPNKYRNDFKNIYHIYIFHLRCHIYVCLHLRGLCNGTPCQFFLCSAVCFVVDKN